VSDALRQQVRERSGGRCEYCHLPDWRLPLEPFHVTHLETMLDPGPMIPQGLAQ
jgi:hypothetical protein